MNNASDFFGHKIVEGGLWLSGGAVIVRLLSFFTTVIILRTLTVGEYGTYNLVLSAFGFFAGFFISGLDDLITNDLARDRGEQKFDRVKKLFVEYSIFKLAIGIVLFLIMFFGAVLIQQWYQGELMSFLRVISLLFIFMVFERMLHLLFAVYLKFRLMSLFTMVEETTKFLLVLFLVFWWGKGVMGLVVAYVFSTALALLVFLPLGMRLARDLLVYGFARESVLRELVRYHGKWGLASKYLADAQKPARPWIIQFFFGREAVGLYSLAEGIYAQITSLLPISNLLTPLLPQELHNHARMRAVLYYGIKFGTVLFFCVGVVAWFGVPVLLAQFFPQYLPAVALFRIMVVALLMTAATHVVNTILYSYREQKRLFLLLLLRFIFLVTALLVFLYLFGLQGSAIEFVVTVVFFLSTRYYVLKKVAPDLYIPLREYFRINRGDLIFIGRAITHLRSAFFPSKSESV